MNNLSWIAVLLALVALTSAQCPRIIPPAGEFPAPSDVPSLDLQCYRAGNNGCAACKAFLLIETGDGLCEYLIDSKDASVGFCASHETAAVLKNTSPALTGDFATVTLKGKLVNPTDTQCPLSSLDESNWGPFDFGGDEAQTLESLLKSESYSPFHEQGYCLFPNHRVAVERSGWLELDAAKQSETFDYCLSANSPHHNVDNAIGDCPLYSEVDAECLRLWGRFYCTNYCPDYGTASSGFCRESYDVLSQVCLQSTVNGRCVPDVTALLPYVQESEETFCLNFLEVDVSDRFDHDYKVFGPFEELPNQNSDCEHTFAPRTTCATSVDFTDSDAVICGVPLEGKLRAHSTTNGPFGSGQTCRSTFSADFAAHEEDLADAYNFARPAYTHVDPDDVCCRGANCDITGNFPSECTVTPQLPNCRSLKDGLTAYYSFNGEDLTDASPEGNDATWVSMGDSPIPAPVFSTTAANSARVGNSGFAVDIPVSTRTKTVIMLTEGLDGFPRCTGATPVVTRAPSFYHVNGQLSISMWLYINTVGDSAGTFLASNRDADSGGGYFWDASGRLSDPTGKPNSVNLPTGRRFHLVKSCGNSICTVYVDGVSVATHNKAAWDASKMREVVLGNTFEDGFPEADSYCIGVGNENSNTFNNGCCKNDRNRFYSFDDVAFWNRELTSFEVEQIHSHGSDAQNPMDLEALFALETSAAL
eukprot:TRINITY_DN14_c0_g1_i1.p1 TRINITY_DN14_c0_g1~~TRINITY_DN14_c0_g1_i1.p1  ORF type:complete len:726 (-),score=116.07 TRINITY_DN14_c0_g1_i1:39-2147(-)